MINALVSQESFLALFVLFAIGAIGALALRKHNTLSNWWSGIFSILGSSWALLFSIAALYAHTDTTFIAFPSFFSFFQASLRIDPLSALFMLIIACVALPCSIYSIGYVRHFYKKYDIGILGFFYNIFIASMLLVVSASNALWFLLVWELMSLASYFLVSYEHKNQENVNAGVLYFAMTHAGTACIVLAFLILYAFLGSFDFATLSSLASTLPGLAKNIVFILMLIGFGTKAGIIPLHVWLPKAHPAAPSHISALMSGVMIKTGIYMIMRMLFGILTPLPLWWGFSIIIIGAMSSLLGVLYALSEHDLKKLLAYHSIENIGIILLGLGSSATFFSLGMEGLAIVGLTAALFHTINHATFKSLLFLSAGSVVNQTHTRNIEEYGGLIKRMPQTAFFFLIGSMAISALPPFNGFFSEWLTFQSLFQGIALDGTLTQWIFMISAGALALTSGLAVACFVKAFGSTFLARARSSEAQKATESGFSLRIGMAGLAILCVAFGIFSGSLSSILQRTARYLISESSASILWISSRQTLSIGTFSSVSAVVMIFALVLAFALTAFFIKRCIYKEQTIRTGPTWDCGTDLTPRMEITATGFSRSIIMIFKGILKPTRQVGIEYRDAQSRYLPVSRTITLGIQDTYRSYLYEPLSILVTGISTHVKKIQTGNINTYILYMFMALVATLLFI